MPSQRVSDNDRAQAVELLRHHCGEGVLTLDEFGDRVTLVYDAGTRSELEDVLSDLPQQEVDVPETRRRRVTRWAVAIMGGNTPKGRIRLADTTNVVAVMGGCELDLRNAEIDGDEVVINCLSVMGGIEIIVPEGISVDFTGIPLLGGTECRIADVPIIPGSPRIVVRAVALMGGVEVMSRKTPAEEKALRARRRAERADVLRERALQSAEKAARRLERHAEKLRAVAGVPGGADAAPADSRAVEARTSAGPSSRSSQPSGKGGLGIVRIAEAVAAEWDTLAAQAAPEGMVSVLFSEIDSFAQLSERVGEPAAAEILRRHDDIVGRVVRSHGGYSVRSDRDAFLVAFGGASRAMRCAKEIQRAFQEEASKFPEPLALRMGLHAGEAEDGAVLQFLDAVVLSGAGIACEAASGEILVSGLLRDLAPPTGEFSFGDSRKVSVGAAGGTAEKLLAVPLSWR